MQAINLSVLVSFNRQLDISQEHLGRESQLRDCLDQVSLGMSVGDCLDQVGLWA